MKRYGIRARMDPTDPIAQLIGPDFHLDRWYSNRAIRDRALQELRSGRPVYLSLDLPVILYAPIEKESHQPFAELTAGGWAIDS
ncbi:MAG: hypothetical protein ACYCS1_05960 [Gammaproteobacteria bacterium]